MGRHRSVLKRLERIKILKENEKWKDEDSPLGLPKVKSIKIKVKKQKAEKASEETKKEKPAVEAKGKEVKSKESKGKK